MDYMKQIVKEAIAHRGEKIKIDILSEADAAQLVAEIAMKPYDFSLRTGKGRECVNARSLFGVIYFMSHRNNSYLICEEEGYENH